MTTELTWASTARKLATDEGVPRYDEAGDSPPLLSHGSGPA
ncbi:hypothetical protein [Actinomadura rifamycini]|nr:hypothetical protein [Actinomadura rifamycini]